MGRVMRILVLVWEFPPRIVGGISRHAAELYPELVQLGHEIHLLTIATDRAPHFEVIEGVHVHRVPVAPHATFFGWVANMNQSLGAHGGKLIQELGGVDLIHAHDWLVSDAAIALKHLFKIPLVATIHATEFGRYNGLHTADHHYIDRHERELVFNAWRVIVCTHYMRHEVARALACPWDKIDVISNGIRWQKKQRSPDFDVQSYRRQFAADHQKIVYYVGRMGYEKGVHVLIAAAPRVLAAMAGHVKFVIIGGGNTSHLQQQAAQLGLWSQFYFTGFMPDRDLDRFQGIADCAVFPSLYEPFGIVALESFAARVPVVVSDTGGFPEVVRHGETGITTYVNDPASLAWGIVEVLQHPDYAQHLVDRAYVELTQRFYWPAIAQQTAAILTQVITARQSVSW